MGVVNSLPLGGEGMKIELTSVKKVTMSERSEFCNF